MIDEVELYNGFHTGMYVMIFKDETSVPSFGTIVRLGPEFALVKSGNNELVLHPNDYIGFEAEQVDAFNSGFVSSLLQ